MDDTDMPDTRGTGHLAREIADQLEDFCEVRGVSRHQLLRDPRVPMTKNNSANVIHVVASQVSIAELAEFVAAAMVREFVPGSDPGLCVAARPGDGMAAFGRKAKRFLVTVEGALASVCGAKVIARALAGTGDGVIGAVAGVGLASGGNDGRFVRIGAVRELADNVGIQELTRAGVQEVRTLNGTRIKAGRVLSGGKIRPEIMEHRPVVLVKEDGAGAWLPVRRD